jgi:hypothetical protein
MEDPDLSEQHDSDPAALALTDLSPKLNEQRLDITPRDSGPHGMRKDGFQGNGIKLSSNTSLIHELRASHGDRVAVSRIGSALNGAG